MEKKKATIICSRTLKMHYNEKPIENIIVYDETGEIFNFNRDYIEVFINSNRQILENFTIDLAECRVCDLSRKDNFLLEEDDPILEKVYTLYLFNGKGIYVSNFREVKCLDSIDSTLYTIHADITIEKGKIRYGSEFENTTFVTTSNKVTRVLKKDLDKAEKDFYYALSIAYVLSEDKKINSHIADCLQIKTINEI